MNIESLDCQQNVPESALTASRDELNEIELQVLEGELPQDLQGHLFFVASAGSVASEGLPYSNGDPIFNGDGVIYRLDLNNPETVTVKSRIANPPDFYADRATQNIPKYSCYKFRNHGVSRFSLFLGFRNELNTAFVPMQFAEDDQPRLLITYDAGRHYEIDTESLNVVTPVGSNQEWRPETTFLSPFSPVLSTAHPWFDGNTSELFTVNYGRSIWSFLVAIPWVANLLKLPGIIAQFIIAFASLFYLQNIVKSILDAIAKIVNSIVKALQTLINALLEKILGIKIEDFVYLIRWDGQGDLERWRLILPDGSPVRIRQSLHQIGVTRNYIILIDTAFSIGLSQTLTYPFVGCPPLERIFRFLFSAPPSPESALYLIPRQYLKNGQFLAYQDNIESPITVQKIVIPREVLHFSVDYEDAEDKIVLHLGHLCAIDAADWMRSFDVLAFDPSTKIPSYLQGMQTEVMDISYLGRYVLDAQQGRVIDSKLLYDVEKTWGVELYTYRTYPPLKNPPEKLDNIYWVSYGFWSQLLSQSSYFMFKDYRYRTIAAEELLELAKNKRGISPCLFRLDTETMEIADFYQFPCAASPSQSGYMANSPTFVPRKNGTNAPTDGYLICTVFHENTSEIWLFDAANLAQGPLCKLGDARLKFAFSLHTAWLPTIAPRTASYCIPVREDYQDLVKQKCPKIQELFEEVVFPESEKHACSKC